jgi:hypothetical protein
MDAIRDLTWVKHLKTATVVERSTLDHWRTVTLSIQHTDSKAPLQYLYRMLVFPRSEHRPVLALNLEWSILGTACLTEQTATRHVRHQTVDPGMSVEEFQRWAWSRAQEILGQPVAATR